MNTSVDRRFKVGFLRVCTVAALFIALPAFAAPEASDVQSKLEEGLVLAGSSYAMSVAEEQRKDSVWNGAAIGAAAGGTSLVLFINVPCQNEGGGCSLKAYTIAFGIGAAAGMGIGALVDAALHVSPIITREQRGIQLSLAW